MKVSQIDPHLWIHVLEYRYQVSEYAIGDDGLRVVHFENFSGQYTSKVNFQVGDIGVGNQNVLCRNTTFNQAS